MGFGKCPDKIGWPLCFHRCGKNVYIYIIYIKAPVLLNIIICSYYDLVVCFACARKWREDAQPHIRPHTVGDFKLHHVSYWVLYFYFYYCYYFFSIHFILSIIYSTSVYLLYSRSLRLCDSYDTSVYHKNANYITLHHAETCFKSQKMSCQIHCLHNTGQSVENNSRKHHGSPKWIRWQKNTVWLRWGLFLNIFTQIKKVLVPMAPT